MRRELRPVFFNAPEADLQFGGYTAEVDLMKLLKETCSTELLTYRRRCPGYRFLDDVLIDSDAQGAIFIVHWGPHVKSLVARLRGRNVVYHSYSTGYGFSLPVDVPIVTASKHSLAYWGAQAHCSSLFYVPILIPLHFSNLHVSRDIDVLVQERKSSKYLLADLVPALQQRVNVTIIRDWVPNMAVYYNRAKVYLYDSSDYWHNRGISEGFGLPPLEAIACGCTVFSSVNHALADYIWPGFNAHKIRCTSMDYDLRRIIRAVETWTEATEEPPFLREYRPSEVVKCWRRVLQELNCFFDERPDFVGRIDPADRSRKRGARESALSRLRNHLQRFRRILQA